MVGVPEIKRSEFSIPGVLGSGMGCSPDRACWPQLGLGNFTVECRDRQAIFAQTAQNLQKAKIVVVPGAVEALDGLVNL